MPQPTSSSADFRQDTPFLRLNVRLTDGRWFQPLAAPGFHLMELIRAFGLPIKAECGGAGVCATCHVRIPERWQAALPAPSDDEVAKLDEIASANDGSRLACQITMTDALDGMELEVQADNIALQTAFLVG